MSALAAWSSFRDPWKLDARRIPFPDSLLIDCVSNQFVTECQRNERGPG
jgi:hypothetical protein